MMLCKIADLNFSHEMLIQLFKLWGLLHISICVLLLVLLLKGD